MYFRASTYQLGGKIKRAVDFRQASNEVLIHRTGATRNEAVGYYPQVVANVTGALGFAFGGRGILRTLHGGGVGEFLVHRLSCAVNQALSIVGQSASSFHAGHSALEATINRLQFSVAQENDLGYRRRQWLQ